MRLLLVTFSLMAVLAGTAHAAGTRVVRSITSQAETRSYVWYHGATAPAQGAPLVIVLHGGGSSGAGMESLTGFDRVADTAGFDVAYPDAVRANTPGTYAGIWRLGCCDAWLASSVDIAFTSDLIDALVAADGVDPGRVYVVAFSLGAAMGYRLACELSSKVAGIGSVGGYEYLSVPCHPDRPVSVYEIHGTADYWGGSCGGTTQTNSGCSFGQPGYEPSVQQTNAQWRGLDACSTTESARTAGTVTTEDWEGCDGGAGVRLDAIAGGRHCYPTPTSTSCAQFDATQQFWDFLSRRRLAPAPVALPPTTGPIPLPLPLPVPVDPAPQPASAPLPPVTLDAGHTDVAGDQNTLPEPSPAPTAPAVPVPTSSRRLSALRRCVVPDVRGHSLAAATRLLGAHDCRLGTVRRGGVAGSGRQVVAAQRLAAGSTHRGGTAVDVTLARARASYRRGGTMKRR